MHLRFENFSEVEGGGFHRQGVHVQSHLVLVVYVEALVRYALIDPSVVHDVAVHFIGLDAHLPDISPGTILLHYVISTVMRRHHFTAILNYATFDTLHEIGRLASLSECLAQDGERHILEYVLLHAVLETSIDPVFAIGS